MSHLLHFALLTVCCLAVVRPLAHARWVWRMPHTALALWQAVGVSLELSLVGLVLSTVFAPDSQGLLPALVRLAADPGGQGVGPVGWVALAVGVACVAARAVGLAAAGLEVARHRRRHRTLLALVARTEAALPDVAVLDHPAPAAYCLPGPGRHGRVVVSTGALRVLGPGQVAAVVAHERAHLRERHDLVLLPLLAWRRLVPHSVVLEEAVAAVRLLLEMCADDKCCRRLPRKDLVGALTRFSAAGAAGGGFATPSGALAVADTAVTTRTARLLAPARPSAVVATVRVAVAVAVATLLATPVSLFVLPH